MELLKKYCNVRATSIIESVIALSIISVCLYISIMIFASVFTPKTSAKYYTTQNKMNELFYLVQLENDSTLMAIDNKEYVIEEELINEQLKEIKIKFTDSAKFEFQKSFYVQTVVPEK